MYQISGNNIYIDDEIFEKMPKELQELFEIIHTNPDCPCYMLDKQQKGASRFFYCAKASRSERNLGLEDMPKVKADGMQGRNDGSFDGKITYNQNFHPTVKPISLIEYLVKLTSMPNPDQIYLDPFLGSGTTAMACKKLGKKWIGIEREEEYCKIAEKRIEATSQPLI